MLPDIICQSCCHIYLQKQKWQRLQTILTAVMQQKWMHHVCCQTITFLADLWRRADCHTDGSHTFRQTHSSLVTGTSKSLMWLPLWPTCSIYVTEQGEKKIYCHSAGREGGRDWPNLCVIPSLPPIFLCTSVLSSCLSGSDVRWWCAVAWARD